MYDIQAFQGAVRIKSSPRKHVNLGILDGVLAERYKHAAREVVSKNPLQGNRRDEGSAFL